MKRVKITCSMGFLLLLAGLIYLDGAKFFALVLISCVLHEAGHFMAAVLAGSKVCSLRLTAIGAEMKLSSNIPLSYVQDAWIAFAGPCVNLAVAWLAARANMHLFAGLNLCFGVLNLLPIHPMDGACILSSLLLYRWPGAADRVVSGLSVLFSGMLLGLGWAAWRRWGNLSLFCTACWLTTGILKEKNK